MEIPIISNNYGIHILCLHISIDTVGIASWAIASLLYSHRDGKVKGTVMENSNDLTEKLVSFIVVTREYTEGAL